LIASTFSIQEKRDEEVFRDVSGNIRAIGLKKPVTVTPRLVSDGTERYLLACGEGRVRAFRESERPRFPALVVAGLSDEEAILHRIGREHRAQKISLDRAFFEPQTFVRARP